MLFIHSLNTVQTDWWAESVGVAEHVYTYIQPWIMMLSMLSYKPTCIPVGVGRETGQ